MKLALPYFKSQLKTLQEKKKKTFKATSVMNMEAEMQIWPLGQENPLE